MSCQHLAKEGRQIIYNCSSKLITFVDESSDLKINDKTGSRETTKQVQVFFDKTGSGFFNDKTGSGFFRRQNRPINDKTTINDN